eukprot:CAMPEP_0194156146 /NCGR_PEP_ID=MMETSP0152-20130528/67263_1 /TAXON_ID=1049557 /ORGANISM="Thalassiothrix antarctica, Strain L6-D1" /LENGTH=856 /DNA_ID=CAMNT_0038863621 /DNA_START=88 /DNA_END=2658 /DNA_ORIENTATION=+
MIRYIARATSSTNFGLCRYSIRCHSSIAAASYGNEDWQAEGGYKDYENNNIFRLRRLRNVGILAHVDAGKTTVTERMLELAGIINQAGSVDDGNTTTDFLPAERERGITIQSAAISFSWEWHNYNHHHLRDRHDNSFVDIHLIDTPGHVDFSVEVNRSVAVLDGAVLVVDAAAGVQAQTETVWRAMTRASSKLADDHTHEPLPCIVFINKMDKEGQNFCLAMDSIRSKLPGANPIALQLPVFREFNNRNDPKFVVEELNNEESPQGEFVGIVDLVHMRAILYPDPLGRSVEENVPTVIPLVESDSLQPLDQNCSMTKAAMMGRIELIASLANVDEAMEEFYLMEVPPTSSELNAALRRATLTRAALPVLAGTALKGRGIEPLLDGIVDLLPSPLDRLPPSLVQADNQISKREDITYPGLGHALHSKLLAFAFKVVHQKDRGRVVFCRVYSGEIRKGDQLMISSPGETSPRVERVGAMLELTAGGRLNNAADNFYQSGEVCALVGLRTVLTGDTIQLSTSSRYKREEEEELVFLAGVTAPKPVLKVRLEAESAAEQRRLSDVLEIMVTEDPSLVVEESQSTTHISGLGELHIEVTLDRLKTDFGFSNIWTGPPVVAYRESLTKSIMTIYELDKTLGNTSRKHMQAVIQLELEPTHCDRSCAMLSEPIITLGPVVRDFLGFDSKLSEEELVAENELARALILGCEGALKRGPLGSYAMANLSCHISNVEADLSSLKEMPGILRATAAQAIQEVLKQKKDDKDETIVLKEPTMSIEIIIHNDYVGSVLNDLVTNRRGTVGNVILDENSNNNNSKALIQGEVPLVEILGYANGLRSMTGGEGAFTAEYKGHATCNINLQQ